MKNFYLRLKIAILIVLYATSNGLAQYPSNRYGNAEGNNTDMGTTTINQKSNLSAIAENKATLAFNYSSLTAAPPPAIPILSYATTIFKYTKTITITPIPTPTNSGGDFPQQLSGLLLSTLAGSGSPDFANGTGISASFNSPAGTSVDGSGNAYVADINNSCIRKITPSGVVTTLAGSGTAGFANGTGTAAKFYNPTGVAVDGSGNVYVADQSNYRIRKITAAGVVSTLAGETAGYADGKGTAASFMNPRGVAVDGSGNVYVADAGNNSIRKITPVGVVTTLAGGTAGYADGNGTAARFQWPQGIAVDGSGNIYVADHNNNCIRKITSTGLVTTLAGNGTVGYVDGKGTAARFKGPEEVTVDVLGNLYVADAGNNRICKITSAGEVTTLASSKTGIFADGSSSSTSFSYPFGVALNSSATKLYVAEVQNQRVRTIDLTGYSVSPNLPEGLKLNDDGSISGTPTIASAAADYTITATNISGSGSATINIGVNESPTDITLSASSIDENVATNSIVGILSSTDVVANDTFNYILVAGNGDTDNASFNINGSSLSIIRSLDFETKNSYSIRIRTTDQGDLTYEKALTITIKNVNESPTDIALSTSSINENVVINSTVGTLNSTDVDAGNTFTYTLASGSGDMDNASFNISGNSLRITNSPDFETKNSYSVRLRTTDQGGLTYEKAFAITINDVNDSPTNIALSEQSINENVAANTTVGTLSSTDDDTGNTFTYILVAGSGDTDDASFNISGNSLRISFSPDFEKKSSYSVRIRTTDQGGLTFEKAIIITINDVTEAPTVGTNIYTYTGTVKTAAAIVETVETIDWYAEATGGVKISAPSGINVGTYSAYAEARNITTGYVSATRTLITLTITPAKLTITADNKSVSYGDNTPILTYSITGLVNNETEATAVTGLPTLSTEYNSTTALISSPVIIIVTIGTLASTNYSFTVTNGTVTINRKALTVTAKAQTKVYGEANPTLSFNYSGWQNGDDESVLTTKPTASTTVTTNSPVSVYINDIAITGGIDEYYNLIYVPANFEVIKANQTIAFDALLSKTYGDAQFDLAAKANSGLTVSFSSSNTNVATISGNTVSIVGAGTTTIIASQAGNNNFNAAIEVAQKLTVNAKALTISGANVKSKTYNGNTVTNILGATLFGVIGSDDVILENATMGAFSKAAVGTEIPVSTIMTISGVKASNYILVQPAGLKADITKKEITVTAQSISKECNQPDPTLAFSFTPELDPGDSFSGSLSREAGTLSGDYRITKGSLALSNNYSLIYKEATFSIIDNAPFWTTEATALNRVVEYNNAAGLAAAQELSPVAFDACDNDKLNTIKVSGQYVKGHDCDLTGSYTNTWTVTDSKGNISNVYTQVITLVDRTAPFVQKIPSIQFSVVPGVCETTIAFPDFIITDACIDKVELIAGLGKDGLFPLGTTMETWKVTDKSGNSTLINFAVTITTYNVAPLIDQVKDLTFAKNSKEAEIILTGIDPTGGCKAQEIVSITAEADNKTIIPEIAVDYSTGKSKGKLILKITDDTEGESVIRVTVKDNGGIENGGSDTKVMTFKVKIARTYGAQAYARDLRVNVYPNPTHGIVTIDDMQPDENTNISVYSINGALIINKISKKTIDQIDLSNIISGTYLLKVNTQIIKIIKE